MSGSLTDVTTGRPVAGAAVSIRLGDAAVGTDRSDAEGRFQLAFDVGTGHEARYLKLIVDHDDYAAASQEVEVVSGSARGSPFRMPLLPKSVASCRVSKGHAVVVGYFRPPLAAPQGIDLAGRIRDTLEYDLVPHLQKATSIRRDPPFVAVCGAVNPESESFYAGYAQALQADVLVGGYARAADKRFIVEMRVADRFGPIGGAPRRAATPPLDLDDPASARLGSAARAPILIGLAAGYEKAGLAEQCVEVTTVAEALLGSLPGELGALRERCQRVLPTRGLLAGGQ